MAEDEYARALRRGEKAYKNAAAKGDYPYLPALDEFLPKSRVQTEADMGLMDIPLEQIVGTKTAGRQNAFAWNFMPLMKANSEFAVKWSHVFQYQMEEGIKDPITAYEYMNKYYVLEGNKRVSVLKYLGAYSIEGNVTRVIPKMTSDPQVKIFYEYMEFYRRTGVNYVTFTREGSFLSLLKACGKDPDHIWTEEERSDFSSDYLRFQKLFEDMGGKKLAISCGDAFLFYLGVYPYAEMAQKTTAQIRSELEKIWTEFSVLEDTPEEALVMDPDDASGEKSIFTMLFGGTGSKQLSIAFIYDKPVGESGWVYGHELGRMHLEQVFKDQVVTSRYFLGQDGDTASELIENAITDGNQILFVTSERFLSDSLKAALAYPKVKILTCCVNRPYKALRTYYGRMYEAKYLAGMIAGSMTENDKIAYAADYPIYGTLANINAFALGAAATNPRAKIYLHWYGKKEGHLEDLLRAEKIEIVSDVDLGKPSEGSSRRFGLYRIRNGFYQNLAAPMWNWGKFYEKMIRDIASGSWNEEARNKKALNYWWGISGDIVDLIVSAKLPSGVKKLNRHIRGEIYNGIFHPFHGEIIDQDGEIKGTEGQDLDAESIITMDWLCSNVIGSIPQADELTDSARELVEVQGVIPTRREPSPEEVVAASASAAMAAAASAKAAAGAAVTPATQTVLAAAAASEEKAADDEEATTGPDPDTAGGAREGAPGAAP